MFIINNINTISNRLRLEKTIRYVRFLSYTIQSFTVFTYRPGNVNISMKLALVIHGPQRVNLSVSGLWSIFFPNDEPIHFGSYVSTAGQNVNFVHVISDIWIPIRSLWYLWLLRINPWLYWPHDLSSYQTVRI